MANPLIAREILDYVARHQPYRSVKAISEIAGLDGGNLHGSLGGRRLLPLDTVRRVSAALGLRVANKDGETLRLELMNDTVLHLEVNVADVFMLTQVLQALNPLPVKWRSISKTWAELVESPGVDESRPGVYTLALARFPQAYVVVHLAWPTLRDAIDSVETYELIQTQLGGSWISKINNGLSASDTLWIRLRAGFESVKSLDKLLGEPSEPTLEDWVEMLSAISRRGLTPESVIKTLEAVAPPVVVTPVTNNNGLELQVI
jgi:hypothetical protein